MILTIPGTPPSVNHYRGFSRRSGFWVRPEAKRWKRDVAVVAGGSKIIAKAYRIRAALYLAKGARLDADNAGKLICDALQDAGVISSDSKVMEFSVTKSRDWQNPRTVIEVSAIEEDKR
ncbi:MAG: RusA family crossover junction endodeoxyribonuclease [Patescibacteria group bacterium]|nr:RusA family crossover junction endodeoxyribonuclease [Patescibacteria group bacterium]